MATAPINHFRGRFHFLSNFYPSDTLINGLIWPTVEHFFQAEKMLHSEDWDLIRHSETPAIAKKLGRQLPAWPDWRTRRERIMLTGLCAKFDDPHFRALLDETGDAELIEGNTWKDTYWGVDLHTGKGLNRLGHLLMLVRAHPQGTPACSILSSTTSGPGGIGS